MPETIEQMIERLCRMSREHAFDPFSHLDWPDSLDQSQWFVSPELLSLAGTRWLDELDEAARMRLSFFEAVNFFSINIHGERLLIEGLARRLYRRSTDDVSAYLHHFLDEENKHMYWFGRFCRDYAGKVYPEKRFAVDRDYAEGEEEFLFFARALLFEELVDIYNRRMGKDMRLAPIAREINRLHHFEEARHLVFGRRITARLYERGAATWDDEVRRRIAEELAAFFDATWKDLFNPEVYRDAGLAEPFAVRRDALADATVTERRTALAARSARTLLDAGALAPEALQ
ncbi:MAG: diiron oxygenase [Gammaproteobacteria bacterium]|nr:diiron oxygenase [Gammaproteobacteria bacterium]